MTLLAPTTAVYDINFAFDNVMDTIAAKIQNVALTTAINHI